MRLIKTNHLLSRKAYELALKNGLYKKAIQYLVEGSGSYVE